MSKRSCIYPCEVALLIGKTERSAQRLLRKIRIHVGKKQHQFITIRDFATFTGIDEEDIRNLLK